MWPYYVLVILGVSGVLWEIVPHKQRRTVLIVSAVLIGLLVWGLRSEKKKESREQEAQQAQDKDVEQHIARFAERYDAVTDWRKSLSDGKVYSAELTALLVRDDGRPVLFVAQVKDVTSGGGEYMIHFDVWGNPPLTLELVCKPEQARNVMAHRTEGFSRYAVVAIVTSVSSREEYEDNGTHTVSLVKGSCVEIMSVGFYFGDLLGRVSS